MLTCAYSSTSGMGKVSDSIYGTVNFRYTDSSERTIYLFKEKHLSNWWFPGIESAITGTGWAGPNEKSARVGTFHTAISNPLPGKKIGSLIFKAAANESQYNLFAITLSDQQHYVKPVPQSFGGPDNWAAATNMAALMEGMAGIKDMGTKFDKPIVAPRWAASLVDSINVTSRYAASDGYVSYQYVHDRKSKTIRIVPASGGNKMLFHVLLPEGTRFNKLRNMPDIKTSITKIENSSYVDFEVDAFVKEIVIEYSTGK